MYLAVHTNVFRMIVCESKYSIVIIIILEFYVVRIINITNSCKCLVDLSSFYKYTLLKTFFVQEFIIINNNYPKQEHSDKASSKLPKYKVIAIVLIYLYRPT